MAEAGPIDAEDLAHLPGADIVIAGLRDLAARRESDAALLVTMAAARLRSYGLPVPREGLEPEPELRLHARLAVVDPRRAHAQFNALVRRLVSFENALAVAIGRQQRGEPTRPS